MKHLLILTSFCLLAFTSRAQDRDDIVKKIVEATKSYNDYHIIYKEYVKFSTSPDTGIHVVESVIYQYILDMHIGWHTLKYKTFKEGEEFVLVTDKQITELNAMTNMYSKRSVSSRYYLNEQQHYCYRTMLKRSKADYKDFKLISSDNNFIVLENLFPPLKAEVGNYNTVKIVITADAKTFLPVSTEHWTTSGEYELYTKYKVLEINKIPKIKTKQLMHIADSMQSALMRHTNGDSFNLANKKPVKMLNAGDTAFRFISMINNSSDSFTLAAYKDSIVLLDFFYTTCGPCCKNIPYLITIQEKYKAKGVHVIGMDPYKFDWPKLEKFVKNYSINYPIVEAQLNLLDEYGVQGFPKLILIKNGIIVKTYSGYTENLDKELEKDLNKALKG
ncbi:MAG: TlpA family protein disulfide reductase [Bacteroidia bacterium]|nr:TlpA family protein disulfide reductase [Bacteroidia bacterium]